MEQVPIYLFMDTLDECPNDLGILLLCEKALCLIKELVGLHHPNLHPCVTSCPEFNICTTLGSMTTQQVSLHNEIGQEQDIIDYITSVIHLDVRMKGWQDNDKTMIIGKLTERVNGM